MRGPENLYLLNFVFQKILFPIINTFISIKIKMFIRNKQKYIILILAKLLDGQTSLTLCYVTLSLNQWVIEIIQIILTFLYFLCKADQVTPGPSNLTKKSDPAKLTQLFWPRKQKQANSINPFRYRLLDQHLGRGRGGVVYGLIRSTYVTIKS